MRNNKQDPQQEPQGMSDEEFLRRLELARAAIARDFPNGRGNEMPRVRAEQAATAESTTIPHEPQEVDEGEQKQKSNKQNEKTKE